MKVVNLKQAILQAWKERWSDYQWAINIKKNFPKGASWDYLNLAEALMEQAMIVAWHKRQQGRLRSLVGVKVFK
uniref:Mediator of RNA polymerase II transcription subunit 24 n=1 Tax=Gouania willdenowi TaxID=441366 RepID=A0A8C5GUR5_GOUWI